MISRSPGERQLPFRGPCPVREEEVAGWGGRIRTSVWRNQNPLPYHLATPQPAWHVNRKASFRQQDRRRNPRHIGIKIEAYHAREDGVARISSGQVKGAGRAFSGRRAVAFERIPPRGGGGCHFPVVSRLRAIFPDLGSRKFPVSGAAMRRFGYPTYLIYQGYSQKDQTIFAPACIFLREFSRLTAFRSPFSHERYLHAVACVKFCKSDHGARVIRAENLLSYRL